MLFAAWELHTTYPMLDLRFFENPRFSAASATVTLVTFAVFGSTFLLTQYFQFVLGYSPLKAGLMAMPVAIGMMVTAPNAPRLVFRWGTKRVVLLGLFIDRGGAHALYASEHRDVVVRRRRARPAAARHRCRVSRWRRSPSRSWARCRSGKAGVGSAVNDTTRQTGGAIGVAVIGSIFAGVRTTTSRASQGSSRRTTGHAVHDSIGSALHAAAKLPAGQAPRRGGRCP